MARTTGERSTLNGAGHIHINGTEYQLNQAHWHTPTEHTINGRRDWFCQKIVMQSSSFQLHDLITGHNCKKIAMGSSSSSSSSSIAIETNNAFKILFHCDNMPLGFASVKVNLGNNCRLREENGGVLEDETLPLSGGESKGKKKVLILMSDTGGGHRASAKAIKRHLLRSLVMIMSYAAFAVSSYGKEDRCIYRSANASVLRPMVSSPLRRSNRGKKLVKIPDIPNIKSTVEKTASNSKQCSEDANDDKKTEKQEPDVGGKKRKKFTAIGYKALFKPQPRRQRIESDVEKKIGDNVSPSNGNIANTTPEGVTLEIKKHQHMLNVDASENHEYNENVSRKGEEAIENINRERDKKRILLEDLKVAADHVFSLRGSQHEAQMMHSLDPEVAPTFPEKPIEAQSHDEPVCESANDIASTGSHTSEKEMVDATVSSEQNGEVPAHQLGDDMDVDVAEKVDSSNENVMAPHVNCGDMEMPAGNYNKENDDDDTLGLDTSHVDAVALEVESAEMGMPAGTCDKENAEYGEINPDIGDDHNETSPNELSLLRWQHQLTMMLMEKIWKKTSFLLPRHLMRNISLKQRLNSDCEKEISEIVAKISLKYEAKHQEADAAYNTKRMELETNINRVIRNGILAEAFRIKCQDLTPVSEAGLMQQLCMLSVSPGQSSGNQQPLHPPLSLQQPQPRPPRLPLQIVHQPAALFSSRPPPPNTMNFWNR
ncbi:hypothetical protein L1987_84041 [Smallanthus sonchifolius]|uniref:Uncharacterized protein n=1 Tax=Smallanthus sonchifolius TaxID=185202 RepID=A0ACB8YDL6_9ASTR|nr:hypothetical protein L1987_84041 [Smallanthus sonchifolius]